MRIKSAYGVSVAGILGLSCVVGAMIGTSSRSNATESESPQISLPATLLPAVNRPADPIAYAPTRSDLDRSPLGPAAAVSRVLSGLDASTFDVVRIGSAPTASDWQGNWFYPTVHIPSVSNGAMMWAEWQSDLLQGDVAELTNVGEANLADVITGCSLSGILPDGTVVPLSGGASDVRSGQYFAESSLGASDLRTRTDQALASVGATAVDVRIFRPNDFALSVIATVPTVASVSGKLPHLLRTLQGSPVDIEGLYVELRLPDSTVVLRRSVAFRTGVSSLWVNPELAGGLTDLPTEDAAQYFTASASSALHGRVTGSRR